MTERNSTFRAIPKCTFISPEFAIFDFYMIDEGANHQGGSNAFLDKAANFKRIAEGNIIINNKLEANVDYDILYLYNESIRYVYEDEVKRVVEACKERSKFFFGM